MHKNSVVHRDIKPENMILDSVGYLRITDFGISQLHDQEQKESSGTLGYMAPEAMNRDKCHFVSDYFALGVIGYEMMFGKVNILFYFNY